MVDRANRGEAFWRRMIERQARTDESVAEFCRREELSTATFYLWRRRLRLAQQTESATGERRDDEAPRFAQLVLDGVEREAVLEIELPCETRLRLRGEVDERQLAMALRCLRDASC